jgi:hypothetical protein
MEYGTCDLPQADVLERSTFKQTGEGNPVIKLDEWFGDCEDCAGRRRSCAARTKPNARVVNIRERVRYGLVWVSKTRHCRGLRECKRVVIIGEFGA